MMNQNPLPLKTPILQKWTASKPPRSLPQICQLPQHHIPTAKEGQEKQPSNSYVIGRHHIVPSQGSYRHRLQDPILPRSQQWHPNLCHLAVQPHQTHHLQANQERATGRRLVNWRGHPPHCRQCNQHTLHLLGRSNGMFLGGCPVFLIMMIGRWSSDAFLNYIRKQVEEFNHDVSRKMITSMFHRHIPMYTYPTVSHLDPRQRNQPDNVKTRRNIGGDMAWQARLPAFAQFHWALRSNFWKDISFILSPANSPSHTQILGSTKMEEASLLVLTELGRGGFESLLVHDSKAQPPLCILWYPLHTTTYNDGGRTMQMPLVSKLLCYLQAAARMELAGISRPHQILVYNGYRHVSNGYCAKLWYPMATGASPMDTGAERELLTNSQDPLERSFCHNSAASSRCHWSQSHPQP